MANDIIELRNITKIYKNGKIETPVLHGLNMTIKQQEFVAICGTSGCGKTTLLNIIGCVDMPSDGEYKIDGEIVDYKNRKKLEYYRKEMFSFIFQDFALMDKFTVEENIEMPLIAKGISRKQRKKLISHGIELVGIAECINKLPSQLSGGQQQRVAIARAVAMGNPIVLADEPTGALDEDNSNKLMDIFRLMVDDGHTIIMVTHDTRLSHKADRVIELQK